MRRMRPTPPPTAMPMIAPVDSAGLEDGGEMMVVVELEAVMVPDTPYVVRKEAEKAEEGAATRVVTRELAWAAE